LMAFGNDLFSGVCRWA